MLLLAAGLIAVQPALACCAGWFADAPQPMVAQVIEHVAAHSGESVPPCHELAPAQGASDPVPQAPPPADCGHCGSCESAVATPTTVAELLPGGGDASGAVPPAPLRLADRQVLRKDSTGPPPSPILARTTPVSLRQQLRH